MTAGAGGPMFGPGANKGTSHSAMLRPCCCLGLRPWARLSPDFREGAETNLRERNRKWRGPPAAPVWGVWHGTERRESGSAARQELARFAASVAAAVSWYRMS